MSHVPPSPPVIPPGSVTLIRNVRDYGARGDGVSDDTAAIQAALAAASAGECVYLPNGTYVVSGINLPASSITIAGAGAGSVLKLKNAANASLLTNTAGITDITIRDLQIDGNNANQTSGLGRGTNGILIFNAQRVSIVGVSIHDTYTNAIRLQKVTVGMVRGCILRNIGKAGVSASGIDATPSNVGEGNTDITIADNIVDTITGTGNGIFVASEAGTSESRRIVIADNHVKGAADEAIEVLRCLHFSVTGNVIASTGNIGIYCRESSRGSIAGNTISEGDVGISVDTQGTTAITDVAISNNVIANVTDESVNGAGIQLTTGSSVAITGCSIVGNRVTGCKRSGIKLAGAGIKKVAIAGNTSSGCDGSGISVEAVDGDISITGNVCYNNGQNGALTSAGIQVVDTNNGVVVGNHCFDDQGGATQKYGVYVTGTSVDWLVVGNRARGNTTKQIESDAGARVYRRENAIATDKELWPAPMTVNTNNYAPAGIEGADYLAIEATGAIDLTGIKSDKIWGRTLYVRNFGAATITLKHNSASSDTENKVLARGNADVAIATGQGVVLWLSRVAGKWVQVGTL